MSQPRTAYGAMALNKVLGRMGFAQLTQPGALFDQIAFAVKDHDDFRKLLDKCEPTERASMYRSLAPRLSFEAKALDVYIAELAGEAERKQLPTVGAGGQLIPFRKPEIRSDDYVATQAVAASLAKHHLRVVCRKCTKAVTFSGERKADAVSALRAAGWMYDEMTGVASEICPTCPTSRKLN